MKRGFIATLFLLVKKVIVVADFPAKGGKHIQVEIHIGETHH